MHIWHKKDIILYGKITFYVIFTLGESVFFKKENIIVHENHFLFESQQSILLQKWKKVATQYKHKQQNTNFPFPAFSKESSLNYDQGNRTQEE